MFNIILVVCIQITVCILHAVYQSSNTNTFLEYFISIFVSRMLFFYGMHMAIYCFIYLLLNRARAQTEHRWYYGAAQCTIKQIKPTDTIFCYRPMLTVHICCLTTKNAIKTRHFVQLSFEKHWFVHIQCKWCFCPVFRWGRWDDIMQHAFFKRKLRIDDIITITRAMVSVYVFL